MTESNAAVDIKTQAEEAFDRLLRTNDKSLARHYIQTEIAKFNWAEDYDFDILHSVFVKLGEWHDKDKLARAIISIMEKCDALQIPVTIPDSEIDPDFIVKQLGKNSHIPLGRAYHLHITEPHTGLASVANKLFGVRTFIPELEIRTGLYLQEIYDRVKIESGPLRERIMNSARIYDFERIKEENAHITQRPGKFGRLAKYVADHAGSIETKAAQAIDTALYMANPLLEHGNLRTRIRPATRHVHNNRIVIQMGAWAHDPDRRKTDKLQLALESVVSRLRNTGIICKGNEASVRMTINGEHVPEFKGDANAPIKINVRDQRAANVGVLAGIFLRADRYFDGVPQVATIVISTDLSPQQIYDRVKFDPPAHLIKEAGDASAYVTQQHGNYYSADKMPELQQS